MKKTHTLIQDIYRKIIYLPLTKNLYKLNFNIPQDLFCVIGLTKELDT